MSFDPDGQKKLGMYIAFITVTECLFHERIYMYAECLTVTDVHVTYV